MPEKRSYQTRGERTAQPKDVEKSVVRTGDQSVAVCTIGNYLDEKNDTVHDVQLVLDTTDTF